MNKRIFKITLLFGLMIQQITTPFPEVNLVDVINKYRSAFVGLTGLAAFGLTSQACLTTDYGAVTVNNRDFYWDWNSIDTSNVSFPSYFVFGVGTSAYQVEGNCTNTDWAVWEQQTDADNRPVVQQQCGKACDHWNRYQEDIALIDQIGAGVYRLSLAWDKIQPAQDSFNMEAIEHYKNVVRELKKYNIKVLIGFHHYTDPQWFADLGGFEKEENIACFVNYCSTVFQAFNDDQLMVDFWTIFNSPSGYAFHKYHVGDFPPGIKNNKRLTLTVLKHVCEAHVEVYEAAKRINKDFYIGLLKNIILLDPHRPWHLIDNLATTIATKMTDECMFCFFTTGVFKAKIPFDAAPFMVDIEYTNKNAPHSVDFVGINYYSHHYMKNMQKVVHDDEIQTDNPNYTIYPEGLYRAIVTVDEKLCDLIRKKTNKEVPIYITENGIAHKDSNVRERFFKRHMFAVHKAIQEGYNVKGYVYWSLMDNYEWGSFGTKNYGLVAVDFTDLELKRSVKQDVGTQYFISLMKNHKSKV